MDELWRNPEFVRRRRMELRPARMVIAASISTLLCLLLLLLIQQMDGSAKEHVAAFYTTLVFVQALVLCLTCLSACGQAISSERSLKTYDFLRTTRLTSAELLFGMIFGAPVMGYYLLACTLPFSLISGLIAGFPVPAIIVTYILMLLVAVVMSLIALTSSMVTEKPRPGELLVVLLLFGGPLVASLAAFDEYSPFPAVRALLVLPGLFPLYQAQASTVAETTASFFAVQTPLLLVSVVLYASFGAWLVVALLRNLKKERNEILLLSRWQGIGFSAYLNILAFGLLDLRTARVGSKFLQAWTPEDITTGYLSLNFVILYAIGLAMLAPPERLKSWARQPRHGLVSYFAEDGPSWPWMLVAAALALLVLCAEAVMGSRVVSLNQWPIGMATLRLCVLLVFSVRDLLFMQLCTLTKMKRPVASALFFLILYYVVAATIADVMTEGNGHSFFSAMQLFTPAAGFSPTVSPLALAGLVPQIVVVAFLLQAIRQRLARPARFAVAASAAE